MKLNIALNLTLFALLLILAAPTKLRTTLRQNILPSVQYSIINQGNGNCIGSPGGNANLVHEQCSPDQKYLWTFEQQTDGFYFIRSVLNTQVFDVYGASSNDGTQTINWPLHGGDNQRFSFQQSGSGFFIKTKFSSMCLSVRSNLIVEAACNGSDSNQLFNFKQLNVASIDSSIAYALVNKDSGKCIRYVTPSAGINHLPCEVGQPNFWTIEKQSDNSFYIRSTVSAQVFDVYGAGLDNGSQLIDWDSHGGNNQRFFIEYINANEFTIKPKHSNKCLQPDGELMRQQSCVKGDNKQIWTMRAQRTVDVDPNINYSAVNKQTGFCTKSLTPSDSVNNSACDNANSTYWKFEKQTDRTYYIRSIVNSQVFDVYSGYGDDNLKLINWASHGGNNQRFFVEFLDNTHFMLRVKSSLKCLSASGGLLVQLPCNISDDKQIFVFKKQVFSCPY
jgi:hypothetical protein